MQGNPEIISHLLSKGADSRTVLLWFICQRNPKAAIRLIKNGAKPNNSETIKINDNETVNFDLLSTTIFLLNKNCVETLHSSNFFYDTEGMIKLIELLLQKGANPNVKFEQIPLLALAIATTHIKIIQLLLEYGANPDIKFPDLDSSTSLIYYTLINDYETVKLLLKKNANTNIQNNIGKTALFYAKDKAIAQLLIDKCSDLNLKDYKGYTALNWAAHQNNKDLVELLLAKGADPTIKNDDGESALDSIKLETVS